MESLPDELLVASLNRLELTSLDRLSQASRRLASLLHDAWFWRQYLQDQGFDWSQLVRWYEIRPSLQLARLVERHRCYLLLQLGRVDQALRQVPEDLCPALASFLLLRAEPGYPTSQWLRSQGCLKAVPYNGNTIFTEAAIIDYRPICHLDPWIFQPNDRVNRTILAITHPTWFYDYDLSLLADWIAAIEAGHYDFVRIHLESWERQGYRSTGGLYFQPGLLKKRLTPLAGYFGCDRLKDWAIQYRVFDPVLYLEWSLRGGHEKRALEHQEDYLVAIRSGRLTQPSRYFPDYSHWRGRYTLPESYLVAVEKGCWNFIQAIDVQLVRSLFRCCSNPHIQSDIRGPSPNPGLLQQVLDILNDMAVKTSIDLVNRLKNLIDGSRLTDRFDPCSILLPSVLIDPDRLDQVIRTVWPPVNDYTKILIEVIRSGHLETIDYLIQNRPHRVLIKTLKELRLRAQRSDDVTKQRLFKIYQRLLDQYLAQHRS